MAKSSQQTEISETQVNGTAETENAKTYTASIHQSIPNLQPEFVSVVQKIEQALKMPTYLFI